MLKRLANAAKTWVVVGVGALVLALSAFFILSTFSSDSTFAQEGPIMYAENGDTPVRTFTSEDPEGAGIHWDVTGVDADDFSISGGVLTFNDPPNFENPTDRVHVIIDRNGDGDTNDPGDVAATTASDNMYQITIRASEMRASGEMGRGLSTETHVTVEVTDRNEDGAVMLNRLQPEVGTAIMAMVTDSDNPRGADDNDNVSWTWWVSKVTNPVNDAPGHWAAASGVSATATDTLTSTYTPTGDRVDGITGVQDPGRVIDENKYLRAVAIYTDSLGVERTAIGVSMYPVRAEVSSDSDAGIASPANGSPGFQEGLDYTRTVPETTGRGMNVGAPVVARDPNNDTLTYELDNDRDATTAFVSPEEDTAVGNAEANNPGDVSYFTVDNATGQIKVAGKLDYDSNPNETNPDGKYVLYVRAIDPSGETAEVEVTVTASQANDAPMIMGSKLTTDGNPTPDAPSELRVNEEDSDDRSLPEGPDTAYDGMPDMPTTHALGNMNVFTATDEDAIGQIFWDLRGDDANDFVLSSTGLTGPDEPIALRFNDEPDYEMPTDANGDNVYEVTLVARDSGGAEDTRPLTIFVDNVPEQGKVTLTAEGEDPDQPLIGDMITAMVEDSDYGVAIVTWQWSKSGSNALDAEFTVIPGATTGIYTPEDEDNGDYLRVTATYLDTTSDMDVPGTGLMDERVQEGTNPAEPEAKDATMGDGIFRPTGESQDTDRVFRVTATSKNAVRVAPGAPPQTDAPTFEMASYERMVAENAEVGSIVGMPIQAMGADSFTYDLEATESNDDNYFMVDESTGQIRVGEVEFRTPLLAGIIPVPADAEQPGMEDPVLDFEDVNAFVLIVTAADTADDTRKATARVTVRLRDLNERPYFDRESRDAVTAAIEYSESRSNRVVPLAATEPDSDSLRWEVTGADASDFEIRDAQDIASDGKDRVELHFKSQPDFENGKGSGALNGTPNGNVYDVTVRATETSAVGGGSAEAAELMITVVVMNLDEPGMVEPKWLQPEVNTPLPATLTDIDNGDTPITNGVTWQWYRAKNSNPNRNPDLATLGQTGSGWEEIDVVGSGDDSPTYTPQGKTAVAQGGEPTGDVADETWLLLVKADYTDNHGPTKSAFGITANPVRADVHDDRNNSPDFSPGQGVTRFTRTVVESAAMGAPVGPPVVVRTNEDRDTLTYEILTTTAENSEVITGDVEFFSIDKATGQLRVAQQLSFEGHIDDIDGDTNNDNGGYRIVVRATDPSHEITDDENQDEITVLITATDVNEAPTVSSGMAELSVNEMDSSKKPTDGAAYYLGLGRVDADADGVVDETFTEDNLYKRTEQDVVDRAIWPEPIAGSEGRHFVYSTPDDGIGRRLHFRNPPDYEMPMDANRDNVYEVTIVVRDEARASSMKQVRVTVMNVDEAGMLVLEPEQPDDGMPIIATLTDPDGIENITDWKWAAAQTRVTAFPTADADKDGVNDMLIMGATTDRHTGMVGQFLWAMVDYRDGASVDDDPVTALDERNDSPGADGIFGTNDDGSTEQHKFQNLDDQGTLDGGDSLFHNSDEVRSKVADNAVRQDPDDGGGPDQMPSTEPILMDRMVYENVPSTGYVGMPLDMLGSRNMIGGPDGASFMFAEYMDEPDDGYYDAVLTGSDDIEADDNAVPPIEVNEDPIDKMGQLAAAVVTHFDYEGDKNEYIIEVTDPDAEVAMGPVRVTIMVMNVNEAPTAPMEQRGGLSVTGRENVMFDEILADDSNPNLTVGNYRGTGADAANARWSISGPDMGDFTINASTGELMFNAAPDFENPIDADTDNRYDIIVEADDGANDATLPVAVMVQNVDEMGRVTFWRDGADATDAAIMVGDMLTGLAEDVDGNPGDALPITDMYTQITDANITSWQWAKSMDMTSWTDIATTAAYTVMDTDAGYYLRATAMYTDKQGAGKMESEMTEAAVGGDVTMPAGTLEMYDAVENGGNGDGMIQKLEYLAALDHYIARTIDKDTYLEVLDLYLG